MKDDAKRRYARHLVLPEVGETGQQKLLDARVLVIGAGGLGAAAIGHLAAMGVGTIGVVDHDRVELSNLNRQILYETADIGQPKVSVVETRIEEINPDIKIIPYAERISADNASALIKDYDLVVEGSDNFATRFAVHDACYAHKKTLVSAAISAFQAQLSTFKAHLGAPHPCYRCLVPEIPSREITCAQEGVIGALAGAIGSLQALEVVKEILSIGTTLSGALITYDALTGQFKRTRLTRDPACKTCGTGL